MSTCEREAAVLAALSGGTLDHDLRAHLAACRSCGELERVVAVLHGFAAAGDGRPLGDPRAVWRAAQRAARERALRRATLAVELTRGVTVAAVLASLAFVVPRLWPTAESWWGRLDLGALAPHPGTFLQPGVALAGLAAVVVLVGLSSLYSAWVEE